MKAAVTYWRFRLALWLWARLIPFLAWRSDLVTLLNRVSPPARLPYEGISARVISYRAKRAVRRPRVMVDRPCLREGLLADRFLRLAGYEPELRFGIARASVSQDKLRAHCWIVLQGEIILNAPTTPMIDVMFRDRKAHLQIPKECQ